MFTFTPPCPAIVTDQHRNPLGIHDESSSCSKRHNGSHHNDSDIDFSFSCANTAGTSRERDRDVSSVGSSTSTRSELKQAKRERRQKLKEGEVAEAFTGNELGKSCEDEGMTEIVVPCQLMSSDAIEHHEWATPMLSSPQPVTSATSPSASKRANLRRGKRDLMKSWLATPLGCDDSLSSDSGVVPHNSLLPIRGVDETINTSLEPTSPFSPSQLVLYPPMQDEKLIAKIESSTEYVSQSQTIVCSQNSPPPPRPSISSKSIDRQSPEHSDLIILSSEVDRGNSNIVSNPPLSPLQDTLLSEEDSGAESSTSSVRHSRPRDTIRSIHALRFSPTTTPTVLSAIANDELPTVWHRQHQLPSLFEQMSPPWALTDGSDNPHGHHHSQDRDGNNNHHRLSSSTSRLSLHDVSCTLLGASHNNAPLQVSGLRLQPSTKGAVYFNMDVYNLDAWDSEVMGPFAVDDSVGVVGVRPECGSGEYGDTSSSAYPKAITSPFLGAGASTTDHFQSSLSVLAAYFEEGRQATSTPVPISDDDISSHQALNSGENSTYLPAGALRRSLSPQSGGGGSVFVRSHSFSVRSMSSTSGMARRCGGGNVGSVAANIPEYSCRAYVEKLVASHTTTSAQSTLLLQTNNDVVVRPIDDAVQCPADDDDETTLPPIVDNIITATSTHVPPMCVIVPPKSPLLSFHPVPMFAGGGREDSSAMSTSANAPKLPTFSDIIGRYVTVDTLVHRATSYTEQLANPTSGTGLRKFRRDHDRWQPATGTTGEMIE